MIKSKKYTAAARQQQCTMQIAGVCNYDPDTVVFCHFPDESKGMSIKSDDFIGGDCCSSCHDTIDRRKLCKEFEDHREFYMRRSMTRTMRSRFESGHLVMK